MKKIILLISIVFLLTSIFNGAYAEEPGKTYRISGYIKPDSIEAQGVSDGFIVKVISNDKELPLAPQMGTLKLKIFLKTLGDIHLDFQEKDIWKGIL